MMPGALPPGQYKYDRIAPPKNPLDLFRYLKELLGGFFSAKFNRGSALLCGLLNGAMLLATIFLVSLCFGGVHSADRSLGLSVGLRGIALLLSVLGAMIATHKRPPKKRKRK